METSERSLIEETPEGKRTNMQRDSRRPARIARFMLQSSGGLASDLFRHSEEGRISRLRTVPSGMGVPPMFRRGMGVPPMSGSRTKTPGQPAALLRFAFGQSWRRLPSLLPGGRERQPFDSAQGHPEPACGVADPELVESVERELVEAVGRASGSDRPGICDHLSYLWLKWLGFEPLNTQTTRKKQTYFAPSPLLHFSRRPR